MCRSPPPHELFNAVLYIAPLYHRAETYLTARSLVANHQGVFHVWGLRGGWGKPNEILFTGPGEQRGPGSQQTLL